MGRACEPRFGPLQSERVDADPWVERRLPPAHLPLRGICGRAIEAPHAGAGKRDQRFPLRIRPDCGGNRGNQASRIRRDAAVVCLRPKQKQKNPRHCQQQKADDQRPDSDDNNPRYLDPANLQHLRHGADRSGQRPKAGFARRSVTSEGGQGAQHDPLAPRLGPPAKTMPAIGEAVTPADTMFAFEENRHVGAGSLQGHPVNRSRARAHRFLPVEN